MIYMVNMSHDLHDLHHLDGLIDLYNLRRDMSRGVIFHYYCNHEIHVYAQRSSKHMRSKHACLQNQRFRRKDADRRSGPKIHTKHIVTQLYGQKHKDQDTDQLHGASARTKYIER